MARHPRFDFAGIPQHVVQRGNNRLPCFLSDGDRSSYLQLLGESATRAGCTLHAYVLMDNHVHLLATPVEVGAVSRMMQGLGRSYVGFFNARHGRSGTLWEGRYKACLVDSENYVLACYRYIELNPVRAGIVARPEDFRWSSYHSNGSGRPDALLGQHFAYLSLGGSHAERVAAYRAIIEEGLAASTVDEIRSHLQQQRVFGRDGFRATIEAKTRRFAGVRPAHRPRKTGDASKSEPDPV